MNPSGCQVSILPSVGNKIDYFRLNKQLDVEICQQDKVSENVPDISF